MLNTLINKPLALATVAILGAGFQSAAMAAASNTVSANSRVNATKGFQPGDAVNKGSNTTGNLVAESGPIQAAAVTTGTVDYGSLKGSAITGVASSATGSQPTILGSANAAVFITSTDSFTITSDTLAFGTEVDFIARMVFDHEVEFAGQNSSATGQLKLSLGDQETQLIFFYPESELFGPNPEIFKEFTFSTTVGATFDVTFQMILTAESVYNQTGSGDPFSAGGIDASNTGLFSFTADGLGFNVVAESGTDYTAPVPEPETYGMMLAGLGLIGFMTRRRLGHNA